MPLSTVEDVINLALRDIGWPRPISDIFEGSKASRAALAIYGQTRDELIRSGSWAFAYRNTALVLLKGPPPRGGYNPVTPWTTAFPPPPWLYEYTYPSDCIELGAIIPRPGSLPNLDPRPSEWRIIDDATFATPVKVILTNEAQAIAIYRARVTNPTTWEAGFVATLASALAKKLALALAQSLDLAKEKAQETEMTGLTADRHRG